VQLSILLVTVLYGKSYAVPYCSLLSVNIRLYKDGVEPVEENCCIRLAAWHSVSVVGPDQRS